MNLTQTGYNSRSISQDVRNTIISMDTFDWESVYDVIKEFRHNSFRDDLPRAIQMRLHLLKKAGLIKAIGKRDKAATKGITVYEIKGVEV